MRFDNKQFEQNCAQSIRTIDNLNNSVSKLRNVKLDGISKSLGEIDTKGLDKAIDSINSKFSLIGTAADQVIRNITTKLTGAIKNVATAIPNQIITGGINRATNIETAKFQLSGLKVAWEDIYDDIDYSVKGTAYGMDAAAKAASQLVASGVEFGKTFGETGSSPMAKALRGISGVAAMTNSSFEDISRIFTTVAGNGRLMGDQLNQLASRGLNVAATLGERLGKSEEEIRKLVSKGQIDFATFSQAMDDAFGEHAKEANKTFQGAMSNVKAALSRIGAEVAGPMMENIRRVLASTEEGVHRLIDVINEIKKQLRPVFDIVHIIGIMVAEALERHMEKLYDLVHNINSEANRGTIIQTILNIGTGLANIFRMIASYITPFVKAIIEVFSLGNEGILSLTRGFADLTGSLILSEESMEGVKNILVLVLTPIRKIFDFVSGLVKALSPLGKIVTSVIRTALSGLGKISKVGTDILNTIVNSKTMSERFSVLQSKVSKFTSNILKIGSKFKESFGKVFESAANAVTKVINAFQKGKGNKVGSNLTDSFIDITDAVNSFIDLVVDKGLVAVVTAIGDAFAWVAEKVGGIDWSGIFGTIRDWFSDIGTKIDDFIKKTTDGKLNSVSDVLNNLKNSFEDISNSAFVQNLKKFFDTATDGIKKFWGFIKTTAIPGIIKAVTGAVSGLIDVLKKIDWKGIWEKIKEIFKTIKDKVDEFVSLISGGEFNSLGELFKALGDDIKDFFENLDEGSLSLDGFGKSLDTFKDKVKDFFKGGIFDKEGKGEGGSWTKDLVDGATEGQESIEGLQEFLSKSPKEHFSDAMDKIKEKGEGLKDELGEIAKNLDPGTILGLGIGAGGTATLFSLANFLTAFAGVGKALQKVGDIPEAIAEGFKDVSKGIKESMKMTATSKMIDAVAFAFISLIGGIIALALMIEKHEESMNKALDMIERVFGFMAAIIFLISISLSILSKATSGKIPSGKPKQVTDMLKIGVFIAALAGAFMLIAIGIKQLSDIKWKTKNAQDIIGMIGSMILTIAALAGAAVLIGKFGGDGASIKGALSILAIALAVKLIADTLKGLVTDLSPKQFKAMEEMLLNLAIIMLTLQALNIAAGQFGGDKGGLGILAAAAALFLVVKVLGELAAIPTDTYVLGLSRVAQILAVFGSIVILTAIIGKSAMTDMAKTFVAMGVCLVLIAASINLMAFAFSNNVDAANAAVNAVKIFLLEFGGLIIVAGIIGDDHVSELAKLFVGIGGCMLMISAAILILSMIKMDKLVVSSIIMGGLILIVGLFTQLVASASEKLDMKVVLSLFATIMAVFVSVAGLAAIAAFIGEDGIATILAAAGAMSMVLIALATSFVIVSENAKSVDTQSILLMCLTALSVAASLSMILMAGSDWTQILSAAGAMAVTLGMLAIALGVLANCCDPAKLIKTSAALTIASVGLLAIGAALAVISSLDHPWVAVGALAVSLIALLGAGMLIKAFHLELPLLAIATACLKIGAGTALAGIGIALITDAFIKLMAVLPLVPIQIMLFAKNLNECADEIIKNFAEATGKLLAGIIAFIPTAVEAAVEGLIEFINSLATSLEEHRGELIDAFINLGVQLVATLVETILKLIGLLVAVGKKLFSEDGFLGGITKTFKKIKKKGKEVIKKIKEGIGDNPLFKVAKNIIKGFIEGIEAGFGALFNIGKRLVNKLIEGAESKEGADINSPSRKTYKTGEYIVEGLVRGVRDNLIDATHAGIELADAVIVAAQKKFAGNNVTSNFMGVALDSFTEKGIYALSKYKSSDTYVSDLEKLSSKEKEIAETDDEFAKAMEENNKKFEEARRGSKNYLGDKYKDNYWDTDKLKQDLGVVNSSITEINTGVDKNNAAISTLREQLVLYTLAANKATGAEKDMYILKAIEAQQSIDSLEKANEASKNRVRTLNAEGEALKKQIDQNDRSQRSIEQLEIDFGIEAKLIADLKYQLQGLQTEYDKLNEKETADEKEMKELEDHINRRDTLRQKEKKTKEEINELALQEIWCSEHNAEARYEELKSITALQSIQLSQWKTKKEGLEKQIQIQEEQNEIRKADIDAQKAVQNQIIADEKAFNEKVQKQKEEELQIRKEMAQHIVDAMKKEREEIAKIFTDSLKLSNLDATKKLLYEGLDLFKDFSKQAETNLLDGFTSSSYNSKWEKASDAFITHLTDKFNQTDKLEESIQTLISRGFDSGVTDAVKALGADSEQLKAMLEITSEDDIKKINRMFAENAEKAKKATAENMLNSMKKQFEDAAQFNKDLEYLAAQGLSDGLITMLKGLGAGSDQLQAFLNMTKEQLDEANSYYTKSQQLEKSSSEALIDSYKEQKEKLLNWANDIEKLSKRSGVTDTLLREIKDIGPDSREMLDALINMTDEQLKEFTSLYADTPEFSDELATKIQDAYIRTNEEVAKFDEAGLNLVKGLISGVEKGEVALKDQIEKTDKAMLEAFTTFFGIHSPSTLMEEQGKFIDEGLCIGLEAMAGSVVDTLKNVAAASYLETDAWVKMWFPNIGVAIDNGIVVGINSGRSSVINAAVSVAVAAYAAACAALGVHSPSKKFAELGMYVAEGFANGMTDNANIVEQASVGMGNSAMDALRQSISTINDVLNGEINDPVIRPVLDTSMLARDISGINSLFNVAHGAELKAKYEGGEAETTEGAGTTVNFYQTNNSPKALSRTEIYRQTNNQLRQIRSALS